MKDFLKLKGKFTQKWLTDSDDYYNPIFIRLKNAAGNYFRRQGLEMQPEGLFEAETLEDILKEEILSKIEAHGNEVRALTFLQCGISEFNYIESSISSLNRGFIKLLEAAEPLAAMALVRLQLDNLTYLAAELKYPFRILYKVYFKNRRLSQIQVQGKNLNPAAIRKELDEQHGYNLCELYDRYSSYVHPDQLQFLNQHLDSYRTFGKGKIPKAKMKELTADMVAINRIIAVLLQCQIFGYNSGLIK